MVRAAELAGRGLMKRFRARSKLVVELKGPADFVSQADREADATIRASLGRAFPRHGFLTEEAAPKDASDDSRFVVDPLDGTASFLHGIPHFAVSIALEREGAVVAGVVLDVAKGELFVAEKGRGAWVGRERLRVAPDADLSKALFAFGIPGLNRPERHAPTLAVLGRVMKEAAGIRRMSSAALDLAYVAAGRFAAYYELGLSPWDIAAGALLVQEAAGRVTEPDGGGAFLGSGNVLATNGRLHPRVEAMIRRATGSTPARATRRASSRRPR